VFPGQPGSYSSKALDDQGRVS